MKSSPKKSTPLATTTTTKQKKTQGFFVVCWFWTLCSFSTQIQGLKPPTKMKSPKKLLHPLGTNFFRPWGHHPLWVEPRDRCLDPNGIIRQENQRCFRWRFRFRFRCWSRDHWLGDRRRFQEEPVEIWGVVGADGVGNNGEKLVSEISYVTYIYISI